MIYHTIFGAVLKARWLDKIIDLLMLFISLMGVGAREGKFYVIKGIFGPRLLRNALASWLAG